MPNQRRIGIHIVDFSKYYLHCGVYHGQIRKFVTHAALVIYKRYNLFGKEPMPESWQVQPLPGAVAGRVQRASAARARRIAAARRARRRHERAAEVPEDTAP